MKELDLDLEGFCFHCGTNLSDSTIISEAIKDSVQFFEEAKNIGLNPNVLDIGGGFPFYHNRDYDF